MEEKKITEIKAGARVTVNGRECDWGAGTVVLQNENTGKCLIRFDKPAGGMHDAGGLFRANCYAWCAPEEMTVTSEPLEIIAPADPKKNWIVMLHSVNGKIAFYWRTTYPDARFGHGWLREDNKEPIEALKDWIEGQAGNPGYDEMLGKIKVCKRDEMPQTIGAGIAEMLARIMKENN